MIIKCSKHSDCKATFICLQCGFRCGKDNSDENKRKHKLTLIDDSTRDLYQALINQKQVGAGFFHKRTQKEHRHLEQEKKASKMRETKVQSDIDKNISEIKGISGVALKAILEQGIKMIYINAQKSTENEEKKLVQMIDKYLQTKELN